MQNQSGYAISACLLCIVSLVHVVTCSHTGRHSTSNTTWSMWGAYDLTCSMCLVLTLQFWLTCDFLICFNRVWVTYLAQSSHSAFTFLLQDGILFCSKRKWSHLSETSEECKVDMELLVPGFPSSLDAIEVLSIGNAEIVLSLAVFSLSVSPDVTLPCTCSQPPLSERSAAQATGHPASLEGMRPRLMRSATPRRGN